MRILVTGITGFAGGYLAESLLGREKAELFGTSRRGEWPPGWRHLVDIIDLHRCDLCDSAAVEKLLRKVQPDQVYHLAGFADTSQSYREVNAAWDGNLTATRALYEAVVRSGCRPRILFVGSGLIYGDPEKPDQLFDENCLLRPTNPYAASKAAADLASYQYARSSGLDIVRVRPFNHIGPLQSPRFAVPHFAKQIAAIERGEQLPYLETGNISSQRDLTDVRDMVHAYVLLMARGRTGEAYNAARGETHSMQTVLDRLLALAKVTVEVRPKASLMRPAETSVVRGNAEKLRRETGWSPRYTLDETLADILAFWRQNP